LYEVEVSVLDRIRQERLDSLGLEKRIRQSRRNSTFVQVRKAGRKLLLSALNAYAVFFPILQFKFPANCVSAPPPPPPSTWLDPPLLLPPEVAAWARPCH